MWPLQRTILIGRREDLKAIPTSTPQIKPHPLVKWPQLDCVTPNLIQTPPLHCLLKLPRKIGPNPSSYSRCTQPHKHTQKHTGTNDQTTRRLNYNNPPSTKDPVGNISLWRMYFSYGSAVRPQARRVQCDARAHFLRPSSDREYEPGLANI